MNVVERRVPQITAASELPPTIHVAGSNVVLGRKRRWHFVLQGELGCRIPRGHSLLRGGAEYLDLRLAVRLARNSSVAVGAVLVDMRGPVKHVGSEDAEGCRQAADTSYYVCYRTCFPDYLRFRSAQTERTVDHIGLIP